MEKNDKELLESLIGLTKERGALQCIINNYKVRIRREDSNIYMLTMDMCTDRINLEIDNDIITKCDIG